MDWTDQTSNLLSDVSKHNYSPEEYIFMVYGVLLLMEIQIVGSRQIMMSRCANIMQSIVKKTIVIPFRVTN